MNEYKSYHQIIKTLFNNYSYSLDTILSVPNIHATSSTEYSFKDGLMQINEINNFWMQKDDDVKFRIASEQNNVNVWNSEKGKNELKKVVTIQITNKSINEFNPGGD